MGEIAEMMLDGILCQDCGVLIDVQGCGFATVCESCADTVTKKRYDSPPAKGKTDCRICGKRVKKGQGIKDHLAAVHSVK